jgi:hypothetical protein
MLSQRRAAQTWGVSRARLQRAINGGILSVSADGTIDPAEMLRVFGEAVGGSPSGSVEPLGPPMSHPHETALQAEIKALRAALAAKDEVIAAKDRNLDDLRQALKLLEGPSPPRRRSLWAKLTGG